MHHLLSGYRQALKIINEQVAPPGEAEVDRPALFLEDLRFIVDTLKRPRTVRPWQRSRGTSTGWWRRSKRNMRRRPKITELQFDRAAEELRAWVRESVSPFENDTPEKQKSEKAAGERRPALFFRDISSALFLYRVRIVPPGVGGTRGGPGRDRGAGGSPRAREVDVLFFRRPGSRHRISSSGISS